MSWDGPLFDNHMHIDPRNGRGLDAVRDFHRAGGTHLMLVGKTARDWGIDARDVPSFLLAYERTLGLARDINEETPVTAYAAVGYHPSEMTGIAEACGVAYALELGFGLLDVWERLYDEGRITAVGEVGRPHYPVPEAVWEASNEFMQACLSFSKRSGCPVQLHTEHFEEAQFAEVGAMIAQAVHPPGIVKHFCPPFPDLARRNGMTASVVASREAVVRALATGEPFLMETDYIDDLTRPGAVLGPKTVPKRTLSLLDSGELDREMCWRIHAELPERVYGVDLSAP